MVFAQGNCATTRCTISRSGHAAAKAHMYLRLRGEKPFMSGKASRRCLPTIHAGIDKLGQKLRLFSAERFASPA